LGWGTVSPDTSFSLQEVVVRGGKGCYGSKVWVYWLDGRAACGGNTAVGPGVGGGVKVGDS